MQTAEAVRAVRWASHRAIFWSVMLATAAIRIYYGWLTSGQPVWWDEAEYLVKAKSIALGTPVTGYFSGRPPLLPIVLAGFFRIGLGEAAVRVFLLAASQATVYLTYRIGLLTLGPGAALVGAWLFGLCYLPLFFTMRVMTEIPQLALVLLAVEQLLAGRRGWAVGSAVALSLAVFTRYPAALMLLPLGAYVVVTQKSAALTNRETYVFMGVSALIAVPFLWASWVTYGDPLHQLNASRYVMPAMDLAARFAGVRWYVRNLWEGFGPLLGTVAVAGLAVTGYRACFPREGNNGVARTRGIALLLLVWALVPTIYFGGFVKSLEDRYVILIVPAVFIAAGGLLMVVAEHLNQVRPWIGGLAVAGFLVVTTPRLLAVTHASIVARLDSYGGLKDAGRWLELRLAPEDVVISKSVGQLTYYTSHATSDVPDSVEDFVGLTHGGIDYLVLSSYEKHPSSLEPRRLESLGFAYRAQFLQAGRPTVFVFSRDTLLHMPRAASR